MPRADYTRDINHGRACLDGSRLTEYTSAPFSLLSSNVAVPLDYRHARNFATLDPVMSRLLIHYDLGSLSSAYNEWIFLLRVKLNVDKIRPTFCAS